MSLHFAPGEQEARGDDAPGDPGASRGSRSQRSATAYRTWEVVPDWQADAAALRLATARSESGVATTTRAGRNETTPGGGRYLKYRPALGPCEPLDRARTVQISRPRYAQAEAGTLGRRPQSSGWQRAGAGWPRGGGARARRRVSAGRQHPRRRPISSGQSARWPGKGRYGRPAGFGRPQMRAVASSKVQPRRQLRRRRAASCSKLATTVLHVRRPSSEFKLALAMRSSQDTPIFKLALALPEVRRSTAAMASIQDLF